MWEYTDKVREHFLNPRNSGEVDNANAIGEVGSMACGDALKLTLKIDNNGIIEDAKFQTFGCASAIASASALTEMLKGRSINEAEKITNQDIADSLGGLPKEKMHCSVLGRQALEKALAHYRGEPQKEQEGEIICECFGVTDLEIERAIRENHLTTVEEITNYTKAGGGCEKCHDRIREIIAKIKEVERPVVRPKLTNIEKIRKIEETLEREIRPSLQNDGGDIALIDVIGNRVLVATRGTCAVCKASQQTLKNFVEWKLRELVWPELVVEEVIE
ncbi:Nitrogen fixation protein NifU [uncultured Desulfobacterium sp.]|uniref:Nitrogen fixation protein NifU n=1 Tax=uncultured Desulfobacterium sp. TaxID=201089 RepID=A0A445N2G6_9BACT|nr:Nitrogen fixation protein NifU [uncultured Desulfobacterium sp.]